MVSVIFSSGGWVTGTFTSVQAVPEIAIRVALWNGSIANTQLPDASVVQDKMPNPSLKLTLAPFAARPPPS
jgi:hypothetical protein